MDSKHVPCVKALFVCVLFTHRILRRKLQLLPKIHFQSQEKATKHGVYQIMLCTEVNLKKRIQNTCVCEECAVRKSVFTHRNLQKKCLLRITPLRQKVQMPSVSSSGKRKL